MVDGNNTPDLDYIDVGVDMSGAVSGAFNMQLPVDPNGVIQLANSAQVIGALPPSVVGLGQGALRAIGGVADEIAGAMPAINLIGDIASGHGPTDPNQLVSALAATAAIVNPLAGAIVGAMGEAVIGINDLGEQVFKDLGLISTYASQPSFTYYGFVKKDIPGGLPWGPTHPNWHTWDYWMTPVDQGWRWGTLPMSGDTYYRQLPWTNIISALGHYPKKASQGGPYAGPVGQDDFETYFFAILEKDLENWMNAQPAVSPRDLLQAAVALWKHTHPDPKIGTKTYSPLNIQHAGLQIDTFANPIEVILSSGGDTSDAGIQGAGQDLPPFTINVKPTATPTRPLTPEEAFEKIQAQIAAAMPPKKVISLKGLVPTAPAKKTIDLRAASQVIAAQPKAPPRAPVAAPPPPSLLSTLAPFAPAAVGVVLMPIAGFLAPVAGLVATGVWLWKKRA